MKLKLENENLWVAEYNPKLKTFHIELVSNKVMRNVRSIRRGKPEYESLWIIIYIGTEEECEYACDTFSTKKSSIDDLI